MTDLVNNVSIIQKHEIVIKDGVANTYYLQLSDEGLMNLKNKIDDYLCHRD